MFEKDGFAHKRTEGDHLVLEKPGVGRPVIIPRYPEIDIDIIKSNMRTAGMSGRGISCS
ncbi:MAG: type II toxin-antitoxin system HicA family toxin [Nitrospirae bacterium]|nr:type II toxin-antitoxin system HicA family toxin [Nitrospirota bacterium]